MNNVISFTPSELAAFIGTIAGVCAGIATIVGIIVKLVMKIKQPEIEQNKRLDAHDERLNEHDKIIETFRTYFANDDKRFKAIERSSRVTQSALLALMKHALNDGDITTLKNAEKQLEDFLIEK